MNDYQGLCHHLCVDNFYTSPQLFKDLLEAGSLACGTIRNNRKGFPVELKDNLQHSESSYAGKLLLKIGPKRKSNSHQSSC